MKIYKGSCHCGHVTFAVRKKEGIRILIDCNCSICSKKGLIHTPAENDELIIYSGEEDLRLYQFGSKTAKYWYCPMCGVEPFHRSRGNPQRYSVNARCLDDFDNILASCGLWFIDAKVHPLDHGSSEFKLRANPYKKSTGPMPEFVDPASPFNTCSESDAAGDSESQTEKSIP